MFIGVTNFPILMCLPSRPSAPFSLYDATILACVVQGARQVAGAHARAYAGGERPRHEAERSVLPLWECVCVFDGDTLSRQSQNSPGISVPQTRSSTTPTRSSAKRRSCTRIFSTSGRFKRCKRLSSRFRLAHPLIPGHSIKLDAEIDYYRKLLDGEYVRLSMPGSPSSTTKKLLKRTAAEVRLKRVFAIIACCSGLTDRLDPDLDASSSPYHLLSSIT